MGGLGKRFPSESFRGGRGSSTFSTGFTFFFLIFTGCGLNITLLAMEILVFFIDIAIK
jgi:hypothetical protein